MPPAPEKKDFSLVNGLHSIKLPSTALKIKSSLQGSDFGLFLQQKGVESIS